MDDNELKKLIWSRFGDQLRSRGVEDLEFVKIERIPEEHELAREKSWLERLGIVGKYMVWIVCGAYGVIQVFVTMANLPEDWKRFQVNYPNTYEVVREIGEKFGNRELIVQVPGRRSPFDIGLGGRYIVFDDGWMENRDLFLEDLARLEKDRNILDDDRPVTLFPSSGTSVTIAQNSTSSSSSSSSSFS